MIRTGKHQTPWDSIFDPFDENSQIKFSNIQNGNNDIVISTLSDYTLEFDLSTNSKIICQERFSSNQHQLFNVLDSAQPKNLNNIHQETCSSLKELSITQMNKSKRIQTAEQKIYQIRLETQRSKQKVKTKDYKNYLQFYCSRFHDYLTRQDNYWQLNQKEKKLVHQLKKFKNLNSIEEALKSETISYLFAKLFISGNLEKNILLPLRDQNKYQDKDNAKFIRLRLLYKRQIPRLKKLLWKKDESAEKQVMTNQHI